MSLDTADIVVVGAGVAGAAAALLLARSGASVTLLERASPSGGGRTGMLVGPGGTAVLAALGLGLTLDPGTSGTIALRYADISLALHAAVGAERSIDFRPASVVHAADPAGSIRLWWRNRVTTIEADLIVGADGASSMVRTGGRFGARVGSDVVAYLSGLAPAGTPALEPGRVTPLGRCGGGQVGRQAVYFYAAADAPPVATALARGDLAEVGRLWSAADAAAGAAILRAAAGSALRVDRFRPVDCARRRDGRLVLIGDAARCTAGSYPMGIDAALRDAAGLTRVLTGDAAGDFTDSDSARRPAVFVENAKERRT